MKILLTGATGFLGEYLVSLFSKRYETVYVLTRKNQADFKAQFTQYSNVLPLRGDITHFDVLAPEELKNIDHLSDIEIVVHAAALYDLKASYSDCFLHNVVGTQNILHLLKSMKGLKAFYAISTIAVGDPSTYFLDEDSLPQRTTFDDAYSATKYQAEKLIRENVSDKYITRIIRPGIIIGDTLGSPMPKIDGPYYFLDALRKNKSILMKLPVIPLSFNPKSKMPLIPVDQCARLIDLLITRTLDSTKPQAQIKTYHLISHEVPTLKEFLDDVNQHFNLKTIYFPVKKNKIHDLVLTKLGIPKEVLPFMFSKLSYDKTNTLEDLPEIEECKYRSYKNILFLS